MTCQTSATQEYYPWVPHMICILVAILILLQGACGSTLGALPSKIFNFVMYFFFPTESELAWDFQATLWQIR